MSLFKKRKTDIEKEEELNKEIIENNINKGNKTGCVIRYEMKSTWNVPKIIKICDFYSEVFPDMGSIIWAPNKENTKLIPYKVIRFDFINDPDESTKINSLVYIVVKSASNDDIVDVDYENDDWG